MAVWIKVAAVIAGLFGLAAVVTVFGLPPRPVQGPASASATAPAGEAAKLTEAAKVAEAAKAAEAAAAAAAKAPGSPASSTQAPSAASAAANAPDRVAKADPQTQPTTTPSFDVVRVLPSGEVVIAGRAVPNASVELLRNGVLHHRVIADASGQFAMVPPNLPPGSHDLTLVVTLPDGRREVSRQSVAVSVPADASGNVVVALASPDMPTQILSPLPTAAASPAAKAPALVPGQRPGVTLGSVEVEEGGRFFATGRSAPGAIVRLYLNDTFLAAATASPEGTWSFTINRGVEPGAYRVRIDDVDGKGAVVSRAEVPFEFASRVASSSGGAVASAGGKPSALATGPVIGGARRPVPAGPQVASTEPTAPGGADVVVDEIRTASVTRGDSLWRISKRIYGKGLRYTVIYEANQKQIRDPRLIYPGQLFVLPGEQPQ